MTGRPVDEGLNWLDPCTEESRRAWAIDKSRSLVDTRRAISVASPLADDGGGDRLDPESPADAWQRYRKVNAATLRPRTLATTAEGVKPFVAAAWS